MPKILPLPLQQVLDFIEHGEKEDLGGHGEYEPLRRIKRGAEEGIGWFLMLVTRTPRELRKRVMSF